MPFIHVHLAVLYSVAVATGPCSSGRASAVKRLNIVPVERRDTTPIRCMFGELLWLSCSSLFVNSPVSSKGSSTCAHFPVRISERASDLASSIRKLAPDCLINYFSVPALREANCKYLFDRCPRLVITRFNFDLKSRLRPMNCPAPPPACASATDDAAHLHCHPALIGAALALAR